MLQKRTPYTEIQSALKVSAKTIAAVAKAAGIVQRHRKVTGSMGSSESMENKATSREDPALQAENAKLKADLCFLNGFFKENIDYLFKSKKIQEFVVNHVEFDEVEQLCQA